MDEIMTDYQFKTLLKMILEILESTESIEIARQKVKELLTENQK